MSYSSFSPEKSPLTNDGLAMCPERLSPLPSGEVPMVPLDSPSMCTRQQMKRKVAESSPLLPDQKRVRTASV